MNKPFVVSLLASLLITMPLAAEQASGACKGGHKGRGKDWAALNLTQDQKNALKNLRSEGRAEAQTHFEQVRAVREKMKEELLKASPDKAVLDGYTQELASLHREMNARHVAHLLKVKTILSADQFETLVNLKGLGPEMGKGRPGCCEGAKACCKEQAGKAGKSCGGNPGHARAQCGRGK